MIEPVDNNHEVVAENENVEKGASMVEYALLVALIAVVCIVAVRTLGTAISGQFSSTATSLTGG